MLVEFNETEFVHSLREVLSEDWVRERLRAVPNFWEIIEYGRDSYEIRNSRMLRWLLDPNGSHGLKDRFFRAIAHKADPHVNTDARLTTPDLSGVTVICELPLTTEASGKTLHGRLDLFYRDPERGLYLAIENKTGSSEHTMGGGEVSQLCGYRDALQKLYPRDHGIFVYLAPVGEDTTEDGWQNVSHESLFEDYEDYATDLAENYHARKIIEDFHFDLKRKLDKSIDQSVGRFLFAGYDSSAVQKMAPTNALWGVFMLLPGDVWEEFDSIEQKGPDKYYRRLRDEFEQVVPRDQWIKVATRLAEELKGDESPDRLQTFARYVWEHRPSRSADHSTDHLVQELMRRLFEHFTGIDDTRTREAVPAPEHSQLCDKIAITQGKRQGLWFHLSDGSAYKLQGIASSQTVQPLWLLPDKTQDLALAFDSTSLTDWGHAEEWGWDPAVLQDRATQLASEITASRRRRGHDLEAAQSRETS